MFCHNDDWVLISSHLINIIRFAVKSKYMCNAHTDRVLGMCNGAFIYFGLGPLCNYLSHGMSTLHILCAVKNATRNLMAKKVIIYQCVLNLYGSLHM